MPYQEAMDRFGIDKPDTRFGMEIQDLTGLFKGSAFKVFNVAANDRSRVAKQVRSRKSYSRKA